MTDTQPEADTRRSLPYIAWRTIPDLIERMVTEEPPGRIDKSYLDSYSGGYQTQVIAALNTLGLRDADTGAVTKLMLALVTAQESDRKALIADLVRSLYWPVLELGTNATQAQMIEGFKEMGVNPGDTMRKVIAFFLNATKYGGVPVSRHWRVPAVPSSGRKRTTTGGTAAIGDDAAVDNDPEGSGASGKRPSANVRTVELASGGTVTLSVSVDLFELSSADEEFVMGLIKEMRAYEPVHRGDRVADAVRATPLDAEEVVS